MLLVTNRICRTSWQSFTFFIDSICDNGRLHAALIQGGAEWWWMSPPCFYWLWIPSFNWLVECGWLVLDFAPVRALQTPSQYTRCHCKFYKFPLWVNHGDSWMCGTSCLHYWRVSPGTWGDSYCARIWPNVWQWNTVFPGFRDMLPSNPADVFSVLI